MATTPEQFISELIQDKLSNVFKIKPAKIVQTKTDYFIYLPTKNERNSSYNEFKIKLDKIKNNSKSFIKSYKELKTGSSFNSFKLFSDRSGQVPIFKGKIVFKPLSTKGSGGRNFEHELTADLNKYFIGSELKELKHGDTIKALFENKKFISQYKIDKLKLSLFYAKPVGKKNSQRTAAWTNNKIFIQKNTGEAVSDVDIYEGNTTTAKVFCSLKFTDSYYIYNGTTVAYFDNESNKPKAYAFFGLSGVGMAGFGTKYAAKVATPKDFTAVKKNLVDIINQALGRDVVLINKVSPGNNDIDVIKGDAHKINILSTPEYRYPETGQRKYAAISFLAEINNDKYKVQFQFRGTTEGALTPRYLRILLKKA
jgi:hypothetical protein